MLGGWVNPHREQQTIPQGQTSIPPKSFSTPRANGQSAPRSGSARGVGRGAGSHTPSTASESSTHFTLTQWHRWKETDGKVCLMRFWYRESTSCGFSCSGAESSRFPRRLLRRAPLDSEPTQSRVHIYIYICIHLSIYTPTHTHTNIYIYRSIFLLFWCRVESLSTSPPAPRPSSFRTNPISDSYIYIYVCIYLSIHLHTHTYIYIYIGQYSFYSGAESSRFPRRLLCRAPLASEPTLSRVHIYIYICLYIYIYIYIYRSIFLLFWCRVESYSIVASCAAPL